MRTFAIIIALLFSTTLSALSLSQAKREGAVGERPDGYVGVVVSGASSEVRSLVSKINSQRRTEYSEISKRRSQTRAVVEALAGKKLVRRVRSGEYYMDKNGRWHQK